MIQRAIAILACTTLTGCTVIGGGGLMVSAQSVTVIVDTTDTITVRDNQADISAEGIR